MEKNISLSSINCLARFLPEEKSHACKTGEEEEGKICLNRENVVPGKARLRNDDDAIMK